ncbi:MAG: L-seryl-tRNA(Sec) selenium transferase [Gemmatimonadota bacterium]|nr:L-seryl-tRNA(Sec) selenium transferase [Gemmatimonadota bacterium]
MASIIGSSMAEQANLSVIPSVDSVMAEPEVRALCERCDQPLVARFAREEIHAVRQSILAGDAMGESRDKLVARVTYRVCLRVERLTEPGLKRVVNATGIVLHTNLGRAPLADAASRAVAGIASGYSNLEADLESGRRGSRTALVEELLCVLTGAEAAAVVNNNAAAVLLTLNTLCLGKEALVSRGELIEIGDSFRIPEIMERSGAVLVEVGTTNRTHLRDYEAALTDRAGLMLAVHPSNYRVMGFTAAVSLPELVALGERRGVAVVHDLGGGALVDMGEFGLPHEPLVSESVAAGADVVTFSADKVLGGPQAGILVGRGDAVRRIRQNPLMRALRCGKLTYAALAATLRLFLNRKELLRTHPALAMLAEPVSSLKRRGRRSLARLSRLHDSGLRVELVDSIAQTGSGAMPLEEIASAALCVSFVNDGSVTDLAARLRSNDPPVFGYVRDDRLFLDLRTVASGELRLVEAALRRAAGIDVEST